MVHQPIRFVVLCILVVTATTGQVANADPRTAPAPGSLQLDIFQSSEWGEWTYTMRNQPARTDNDKQTVRWSATRPYRIEEFVILRSGQVFGVASFHPAVNTTHSQHREDFGVWLILLDEAGREVSVQFLKLDDPPGHFNPPIRGADRVGAIYLTDAEDKAVMYLHGGEWMVIEWEKLAVNEQFALRDWRPKDSEGCSLTRHCFVSESNLLLVEARCDGYVRPAYQHSWIVDLSGHVRWSATQTSVRDKVSADCSGAERLVTEAQSSGEWRK